MVQIDSQETIDRLKAKLEKCLETLRVVYDWHDKPDNIKILIASIEEEL